MAAAGVLFSNLPHIDDLVKTGVRSVEKGLPIIRGAMWGLPHKHFDLRDDELLRFDVKADSINTSVIKKHGAEGMSPCQYLYHDGKWHVIGVTPAQVELELPDIKGSGMVTAVLKKGRWIEQTDPKKRVQVLKKWSGEVTEGDDLVMTAYGDECMTDCYLCKAYGQEHWFEG